MASDVVLRQPRRTEMAAAARSPHAHMARSGPDFICIGMPKAGTGWLYDQLMHHPDFWMPPVKEINYLLGSPRAMKNTIRQLEHSRKKPRDGRRFAPQDHNFLKDAGAFANKPTNFERYSSLFRYKGDLLSGDVSPKYCSLAANDIAEIGRNLPNTKIVLLVRDPIARLWSGFSMLNRKGKLDLRVLQNEDTFRSFLAKKGARERMFPTIILERWRQHAPMLPLRHFFLDDIEHQPDETRRKLLTFVGADPEKRSGKFPANHNRKAAAPKLAMPEYARAVLVEHFAKELRACAAQLGGAAEAWPARYGF